VWDLASESLGDDTLAEEENAHISVLCDLACTFYQGFFTFQTTSGFTVHGKTLSAFTLTRKARPSTHQFLQNRKKNSPVLNFTQAGQ